MTSSPTPAERAAIREGYSALIRAKSPTSHIVETVIFALSETGQLVGPGGAWELERLRARVADLVDQHDDLAHALGRRIGTEWSDLISIAADGVHAEETARKLREQVAALEEQLAVLGGQLAGVDQLVAEVRSVDEDRIAYALTDKAEPYVSRLLPPRDAICARPGCGHSGADHHHGDTKCWAYLPNIRGAGGTWSGIRVCECPRFALAGELTEALHASSGAVIETPGADVPAPRCMDCHDVGCADCPACPACDLPDWQRCVACGRCQCDRHDGCVRPTAEEAAVRRSVDAQFPIVAAFLAEDPHDGELHHPYRLGRDLPEARS